MAPEHQNQPRDGTQSVAQGGRLAHKRPGFASAAFCCYKRPHDFQKGTLLERGALCVQRFRKNNETTKFASSPTPIYKVL